MIYSFPLVAPASSYKCSLGHMGSSSHPANELGKLVRDHSTTDGCIMYFRTPFARMHGVQQLDIGSSLVEVFTSRLTLGQWSTVARSCDSLSIKFFFIISSYFSRPEQCRDDNNGTG